METIKDMLENVKEKYITGGAHDPEVRREVLEDYQRAWATAGDTVPGGDATIAATATGGRDDSGSEDRRGMLKEVQDEVQQDLEHTKSTVGAAMGKARDEAGEVVERGEEAGSYVMDSLKSALPSTTSKREKHGREAEVAKNLKQAKDKTGGAMERAAEETRDLGQRGMESSMETGSKIMETIKSVLPSSSVPNKHVAEVTTSADVDVPGSDTVQTKEAFDELERGKQAGLEKARLETRGMVDRLKDEGSSTADRLKERLKDDASRAADNLSSEGQEFMDKISEIRRRATDSAKGALDETTSKVEAGVLVTPDDPDYIKRYGHAPENYGAEVVHATEGPAGDILAKDKDLVEAGETAVKLM